jgi:hypothetical protein
MNKALSRMLLTLREKIKADGKPNDRANVDLVFDIATEVLDHVVSISESLKRIADAQEKLAKK